MAEAVGGQVRFLIGKMGPVRPLACTSLPRTGGEVVKALAAKIPINMLPGRGGTGGAEGSRGNQPTNQPANQPTNQPTN